MAQKLAKKKATKKAEPGTFSAAERDAMRERAREVKAGASRAEGEKALLAKIAQMPPADRALAERIHSIVTKSAPDLAPRTWYGMPAYAKDGDVVCFFKGAAKFKERYATFGFKTPAKLDEGSMWPTSFAVTKLTAADEARIAALVRKAVTA